MSADEVVFYHGTRRGFTRGGYVTPRAFSRSEGTMAPLKAEYVQRADASEYVFVTTSLELAWVYAWHAPGRGKPKVLRVEPDGEMTRDPEHSADMQAYRMTGWGKVLEVLTEPAVSEEDARDGWADV